MRNFKKFLALVLAMLMVSACAVSVSAAFNDQAAIDKTDFEDAVAMLEMLGVVKGDENKNFNPNNTLRRDEAAVMVSKFVAGAAGQSMDWTAETTKFDDVDAKWSFAYINYVADRKIMIGTDKGFEPTRELQIDEAIALALKAADPSEVRRIEIEYAKAPTSYWAAYYIDAAEKMGLTANLGVIYDYEAACSKAMFAQVIVNALTLNVGTEEEPEFPFLENFDIAVASGMITNVTDKAVVVGNASINLAAFNAKLEKGTAADYLKHNVTVTYSVENNTIYDVEITTAAKSFIYSDKLLANAKDADNKDVANKLVLDGVTYVVGNAGSNTVADGGIGGGTATTNYVNATGLKDGMVPTYYKAVAYDDNADAKYDRLDIVTYEIAKLTKGTEQTVTRNDKEVKVFGTTVNYFDAALADTVDALLTIDGADFTAWAETPVLVNVTDGAISIIETAKTVTGTVSNIKDATYIYVAGNKYDFAGTAFEAPEAWVLGQNITIYTINGKYVAVASADTGVTSGMVTKVVLVDNVTLDGDDAVISGYEFSGSALAPITLKVIGAEVGGRLKTAPYGLMNNAFTDDGVENDIDYNKDNKFNKDDNAFTAVALGSYDADGNFVPTASKQFADKTFYTFQVTSAGAYLAETQVAKSLPATSSSNGAVTFDGSYIKVANVAKMKLAATYQIVADVAADTTKAYNFYSATYSIGSNAGIAANTNLTYVCVAADGSIVTDGSKDVAFIYISAATAANVEKTVDVLADDLSIVLIVAAESYSLDLNTYKAYDIFTGAEVYVTSASPDIAPNTYATVKGTEIVVAGTDWIGDHAITTTAVIEGTPDGVYAFASYLKGEKDDATVANQLASKTGDANKVVFGIDNVTAMMMKDGKLVVNGDFKISSLYNTASVYGFINGGKVVIVPEF